MKYKLVAFDMDGTLIVGDSCWETIHNHFGTKRAAKEHLRAWEKGEIDYMEFMRRDIALWEPIPTLRKIKTVLSAYSFAPNVIKVVEEIHRKSLPMAIVTGGLDLLANDVAHDLRIQHVLANGLVADKRGRLTGEGILRVEPTRKDVNLMQLTELLGISPKKCVAVGDSKHDAKFLEFAGLAVAVGQSAELARVADVVIKDFEHFPKLLDYI